MSTNLDKLVEGIRSKRSEKLPQAKARLEKLKAAKKAVLTTRTRAAAVAANNPDLQAKLNGVRYEAVLQLLDVAISTTQQAFDRLDRPSIHIGVAGKSRQGKSQILQMLTGLADQQIPTGDGMPCTAARSIIHNVSMTAAKVHYLTKDGILEKKVYPSYAPKGTSKFALGFPTPRPASLEVFLSMSLPTVDTSDGTSTSAETNWKKVENLQKDLRAHPELVSKLGAAAEDIDITHVRDYIVKDNGEVLHNVVDRIEMWTPFDIGLPEGLTVYDLPGLGDPTPGIREDMLKSLKKEADVVLFMRKAVPDGEGEYWHHEDDDAFDDMKSIYSVEDVKPAEWIQLVLNLDSRNGHVNARNTENLRKTVAKGFVPVVCDCGSKDAVRAMINENFERLVGNVARIDDLRIRQADVDYSAAMDEVRAVYRRLREASADIVAQQSGFDFKRHFKEFKSDLRDPLKKELKDLSPELMTSITEILKANFDAVANRMAELYDAYDAKDKFPEEFPIFTKKYLAVCFGESNAPTDPVGISVRTQREALFKLYRSILEGCCERLDAVYFENVVAKVFENKAVCMVTRDSISADASPREKIDAFAKLLNADGRLPTLASAVSGLQSFGLKFESAVLPALYGIPAFSDFNPESHSPELDDVSNNICEASTKEDRAEILYAWQRYRCEAILSSATSGTEKSPLTIVSNYVSNIMQANFSSFIFSFIWGDDCEDEWERLTRSNQSIFWKEEFETAERNSAITRDWNAALSELRAIVG